MKNNLQSYLRAFISITLVAAVLLQAAIPSTAGAAQITTRSLTLQAGATDGGSKPNGVVNHYFTFTVPSVGNTNVGSIKFEYCTLAATACIMPTGLSTTSAALGSENGITGFNSINTSVNGTVIISKAAAASVAAGTIASYQLTSVTNPGPTKGTFFVRISTYASTDGSGPATDAGTVTASTAEPIVLDGVMPESLVFCTGETIDVAGPVPDCAGVGTTDGIISFDQLFSPTDTATATSQMAASTNAGAGYAISVNGATMTSGSNTIAAMPAMALGARGVSQFGLNLKANTVLTSTIARGAEVAPAANATNYRGQAATGYDTVDQFKFVSGETVANSYNGSAGGSDSQVFTATYIVNVPGSQPAGTYTTTLTYICTPTF